jgi:hypothetical protein
MRKTYIILAIALILLLALGYTTGRLDNGPIYSQN